MTIPPIKAKEIAAARQLAQAATDFANALLAYAEKRTISNGIAVDGFELDLANAVKKVAPDDSIGDWLDSICSENGWDDEGYPVDEDGFRTGGDAYTHAPIAPDGMDLAKEARMNREEGL